MPKNLRVGRSYISLKDYKKKFGDSISKKDSMLFVFIKNDTLIPFPESYKRPKGVNVPYEPKDSTFLEIYEDIVFRKHQNFLENYKKTVKMRYWKNTINICFDKSVKENTKIELTKFAQYLSNNVDSLNIKFVKNIIDSNYLIYGYESGEDVKYEERIKENNNDYYLNWNNNQQIINCKLQLNATLFENNEDFIIKSKKLLLSSLGHFSFTSKIGLNNLFSSFSIRQQKFTAFDLEILKYHYSYGICKGTDLETFEQQHKSAIDNFNKTGHVMYFRHLY